MTTQELAKELNLTTFALPEPDRRVEGVYCGDLLSWVMGRAPGDSVWVTIMSNLNILAVATLCDVSCILLAEGVCPDDGVAQQAIARGINVLGTAKPAAQAVLDVAPLAK